jgi:hypothetical protein
MAFGLFARLNQFLKPGKIRMRLKIITIVIVALFKTKAFIIHLQLTK